MYEYSGLAQAWGIFSKAINVSPLDGDGMPSVSMLPDILKIYKPEMDRKTFYELVEYSMLRIREKIRDERIIAIEKARKGIK